MSAATTVSLTIDGRSVTVLEGTTIAAAVASAGAASTRRSVTGAPRGPLCGMGICFECRATVDGRPHTKTCDRLARDGMDVRTGDA